ncbi:MAG: sodium/proton-translocating pyrophosphatase, partial [Oscillospiraceae bacterium]|nr:sodium/proton-translocating pyrophosphatase [Oscillospiraceae bacterium]
MQNAVILVVFAAGLALAFAAFNFMIVKKMPEGTGEMSEIASAIRVGANAFIDYEYKILYLVVAAVALILAIVTTWHAAVALLIGSVMSGCAGFIGMKIATYANVRVSNKARETRDIGETVKVAFRGGSVMGLCVGGFALLCLFLVYIIFGLGIGQLQET